jgi:uncharacterized protein YjbJ (UPF0337 family)
MTSETTATIRRRCIAPPATWNAAQATSQQIPNTKNNIRKIESAINRIRYDLNWTVSTARAKESPAPGRVSRACRFHFIPHARDYPFAFARSLSDTAPNRDPVTVFVMSLLLPCGHVPMIESSGQTGERRTVTYRTRHHGPALLTPFLRRQKCNASREGDFTMKQSTKDRIKGKAHELKGAVKEKVGHATNNPNLEADGQDEKAAGKTQKKAGQVEKVMGA